MKSLTKGLVVGLTLFGVGLTALPTVAAADCYNGTCGVRHKVVVRHHYYYDNYYPTCNTCNTCRTCSTCNTCYSGYTFWPFF